MQNHKIQTNERKFFKNISIYKIEKNPCQLGTINLLQKLQVGAFLLGTLRAELYLEDFS